MSVAAWVFGGFSLIWLPAAFAVLIFRHRLDARIERIRQLNDRQANGMGNEIGDRYDPAAGTQSSLTMGIIFLVIGLICLSIFLSEYF